MKQFIKIIDQADDYYIATYSAHASIIENIIGQKGNPRFIAVDGGGLVAHFGTYGRGGLFRNYSPVRNKTLHAKAIFLSSKCKLWLSTGNLRKHSRTNEINVQFVTDIPESLRLSVENWFKRGIQTGNHLIVDLDKDRVNKICSSSDNMWTHLQQRIKKLQGSAFNVYAFSPWGSSQFIKELKLLLGPKLKRFNIFTRHTTDNESCWADSNYAVSSESSGVYMIKKGKPFPHLKCLFITASETASSEKLVFCYIGSANLTKTALFTRNNIEHACFFKNPSSSGPARKLFMQLTRSRIWESRPHIIKKGIKTEDPDFGECDFYDSDNFEERAFKKKLLTLFNQPKRQRWLLQIYQNGNFNRLKQPACEVRVDKISQDFFHLEARRNTKELLFIDVSRIDRKPPPMNDSDVFNLLGRFYHLEKYGASESDEIQPESTNSKKVKKNTYEFKNFRFPIEKFINNHDLIHDKKKILFEFNRLDQLKKNELLSNEKAYSIWSTLIDLL